MLKWFTVIGSAFLHMPLFALLKKIKTENTVARAHGFDLYRERHKGNYIPYQEQICSELKNIATISDNGKKYLEDIYQIDGKISVYKLGAVDKKLSNPEADRKELRIVSCARVVDVKQLDRIVDALALIEDINISWTHIGDGELFDSLQKHAKKLGGNVRFILQAVLQTQGFMRNTQQIRFMFLLMSARVRGCLWL